MIRTFLITGRLPLGLAVSAEMHQQLKQEIEQLPDNAWHLWKTEKGGVIRNGLKYPTYLPGEMRKKTAVLIVMWRSG